RSAQAHRAHCRAARHRPVDRRPEVGEVELEPIEPALLLGTQQVRLRTLGQRLELRGVAVLDLLSLAALRQALARELADHLEHEQAGFVELWQSARSEEHTSELQSTVRSRMPSS